VRRDGQGVVIIDLDSEYENSGAGRRQSALVTTREYV
jgi:hypothetical protein